MRSYSCGILLCEVVAAQLPSRNEYPCMLQRVKDEWSAVHGLIVHCTSHDPNDRPIFIEIIDDLNKTSPPHV